MFSSIRLQDPSESVTRFPVQTQSGIYKAYQDTEAEMSDSLYTLVKASADVSTFVYSIHFYIFVRREICNKNTIIICGIHIPSECSSVYKEHYKSISYSETRIYPRRVDTYPSKR